MKKRMTKAALITLVALAACMAMLAGCAGNAGGGTLSSEVIAETGAFKVIADNADANSAVGISEGVTLKQGDVLLVSPDLTKGKLQVTITDKSGNTAFDAETSGRVLETHEIETGTYDITVACKQAGTTGALVVAAVNAEEFEQQDQDLEKALESLNEK